MKDENMTTIVEPEPTAARQQNIVSLPDIPSDMYGNGKEYQQARAWEVIWDWCAKHGLASHSYEHRDQYDQLNGPQMIAQWIIDMKSAVFLFEQCIGRADGDAPCEERESGSIPARCNRVEQCPCGSRVWNTGGPLGAHCCHCDRDLRYPIDQSN